MTTPQQPPEPGVSPYQLGPEPPPAPAHGKRKTSGLAITAFVLACVFFVPFVPLIGGILGIVATAMLFGSRQHLGGRGLAIAAIPVGFFSFLIMQGMLAAVAIPAFVKYIRKSKTVEATEVLDKVASGARVYFLADHWDENGRLLPKRFPPGNTGWVPARICCDNPENMCEPLESDWDREPWRSLNVELIEPHYYQYRYSSSGHSAAARYVIEARGDLDCDGNYSRFRITGKAPDPEEGGTVVETEGPIIEDEIE
jgi:type IV pilus assembly protein PilA